MLASSSMAIPLTLWSPTAERYEGAIAKAMEGSGFPKSLVSTVERITVCEVPKVVFKLQSTRGSTIQLGQNEQLLVRPSVELTLRNFESLQDGSVANVVGIISEVGDYQTSKQGQGMLCVTKVRVTGMLFVLRHTKVCTRSCYQMSMCT